ncbi:MAG: hypothetical protein GWP10_21135 [Nitrospiraceae bacterium]|nr:hypothetical protein [Nitrospiraceae bacterium]
MKLKSISIGASDLDADVEIVECEKPVLSISCNNKARTSSSCDGRHDSPRTHVTVHGEIRVELQVNGENRKGIIPLNDSFSSGIPEAYALKKMCMVEGDRSYEYRWQFPVHVNVRHIRHVKDWKYTADVAVFKAEQSA